MVNLNFNEISSRLSKGFGQAKQYAEEKMGTAPEMTQLPEDYKVMEQQCDSLKATYETLMRIHKSLAHSDDYSAPVGDQVKGVFEKLQEKLASTKIDEAQGLHSPSSPSPVRHPTNQHAAGKVALTAAQSMENEELGKTLAWYGSLMEELGEARIMLGQRIQIKARRPLRNVLDVLFEQASAARKEVFMARLSLDALKRTSSTSESKLQELSKAEKQYQEAVGKAKSSMQAVLDSPILSSALKDMIEALKQYHRQCLNVLEGAPATK